MGPDFSETQTSFVTCAKCGASNPAVSEFCRQCGDAGVRPAGTAARDRRMSPVLIGLCASVITAIPLICLHFVLTARGNRIHNELQRRTAELSVNLGGTQISLNSSKSIPQDAEDARQRGLDQVRESRKVATLESERTRLKSELQAMSRRIKEAEDKYEEADRQLRNANGAMRELREELDARNAQQARTMQKLTETESRLRSAESRNSRSGGYRP